MSRTTRNTLMIGGALILIALLLVCGPLSGRFGSGGTGVEEVPHVAIGPLDEDDEIETPGAATVGALTGAALGEAGSDAIAAADADAESAAVAPVPVPVPGTGGGSSPGTGAAPSAAGSTPGGIVPPVSAAGPSIPAADSGAAAAPPAVNAAKSFDDAVAASSDGGVGPAGPGVDRFAPPVAAPPGPSFALAEQAGGLNSGGMRLPCESPGCRNIAAATGSNTPITPGRIRPQP